MPRIVADTNIYISSLNFAGTADEVLVLGRAGLIEICISPAILDEIAGVLARKFRWSAPRVREATRAIGSFTVLVHPQQSVSLVRSDAGGGLSRSHGILARTSPSGDVDTKNPRCVE